MKFRIKLGFEEITDPEAVIQGNLYADGIDGNAYFPEQPIIDKAAEVGVASENLKKALELPKTSTKTTAVKVARDKWELEVTALTKLEENAVNAADVSDDEKLLMVESANREMVGHTARKKYTFDVERGENSGEVIFTGDTKDAVAHMYTWSADLENFTNKADPWESASAKTTATGVPLGKLAFFHKSIFRTKRMDWEGPLFLDVL